MIVAPGRGVVARGLALFLFIPLVLFLFVRHPEPVGLSLVAGVVLMVGHRRLARPYMDRFGAAKCLWCNRLLPSGAPVELLEMVVAGTPREVRCCPGHGTPAARFFALLAAGRWPLRLGIFVPLLGLLAALAAAAFGHRESLPAATAAFQLAIGLTVNAAAWGYLAVAPRQPLAPPFPAHNFFLLGVRNLLWVLRLVGIWWIWVGVRFFLGNQ